MIDRNIIRLYKNAAVDIVSGTLMVQLCQLHVILHRRQLLFSVLIRNIRRAVAGGNIDVVFADDGIVFRVPGVKRKAGRGFGNPVHDLLFCEISDRFLDPDAVFLKNPDGFLVFKFNTCTGQNAHRRFMDELYLIFHYLLPPEAKGLLVNSFHDNKFLDILTKLLIAKSKKVL